jgi:nucleoside-diphosphate-sugar epimerase
MRALVTGGAGLIGSEIVDLLLKEGHKVISLDNYVSGNVSHLNSALKSARFTAVEGDIRDNSLIKEIFEKKIDWVFHQAVSKNTVCLSDPMLDLDVNAKGTLNLLIAAQKYRISKFIHASTGSVYGPTSVFPTKENHPRNPNSFYGNSKLCAENYVNQFHEIYGLPTVVLRYYHVFGSRQDSGPNGAVVPIFCRKALNRENLEVTGDGSQIRALTHVSDVARINLLAASSEISVGQTYNCASDNRVTIKDLAQTIIDRCGAEVSEVTYVKERLGEIHNFDVDNSKLKSELNFDFKMTFDMGIGKTIEEIKFVLHSEA